MIIEVQYTEAVKGIKEEWLNEVSTKWYDYVIGLSTPLQITYLIVVLHNQVTNGGFHQYFVNGYGQFAKITIGALIRIGALKKADLLINALEIINTENSSDEIFRLKLLKKEILALFIEDDLFEPLNNLDALYDDESEDVVELLGDFLQSIEE